MAAMLFRSEIAAAVEGDWHNKADRCNVYGDLTHLPGLGCVSRGRHSPWFTGAVRLRWPGAVRPAYGNSGRRIARPVSGRQQQPPEVPQRMCRYGQPAHDKILDELDGSAGAIGRENLSKLKNAGIAGK